MILTSSALMAMTATCPLTWTRFLTMRTSSGDASLTTFWGYDWADQPIIAGGNVIALNYQRTTVAADSTSPSIDAGPSPSGEILLRRRIANSSRVTFGVEFGASYTRLDLNDDSPYTADGR